VSVKSLPFLARAFLACKRLANFKCIQFPESENRNERVRKQQILKKEAAKVDIPEKEYDALKYVPTWWFVSKHRKQQWVGN
jgi:hypothetical protein